MSGFFYLVIVFLQHKSQFLASLLVCHGYDFRASGSPQDFRAWTAPRGSRVVCAPRGTLLTTVIRIEESHHELP
jgi:hypothetical protein